MKLNEKISARTARVGVVGLGYVGLPLAIEFARAGFPVTGFDVDANKVRALKAGRSYIKHIPSANIKEVRPRLSPTTVFSNLSKMDCIVICVPTPLDEHREPDMTFVFGTAREIARYLRKGQLVVLESTTYPGTTDQDLRGILEESGLRAGRDFHLAYSPEREDPNNPDFVTSTIPKVVGGFTPACRKLACALYDAVVTETVPVSSTRVAEAAKLLENIYRSVNIALVNELKILFDRMDMDVFEVIEAAKTKPFGFQAFYPGPGLGGHCIPIDPFYLTWKAREYDMHTKFIELAGEINTAMPYYVIDRTVEALNDRGRGVRGARVLVLGLSYKKDVDDTRESPSFKLIELLRSRGARVDYHDPHIPRTKPTRRYDLAMKSVPLTPKNVARYDCVLIATDHTDVDYALVARHARLVVDTRNATKNIRRRKNIVRA